LYAFSFFQMVLHSPSAWSFMIWSPQYHLISNTSCTGANIWRTFTSTPQYVLLSWCLTVRTTSLNFVSYGEQVGPPLWSSDQSSWLQIQRSGFDSRLYQIFWEVVGLERGPLSLMSTIEELLGRKISDSGLENRDYGRGISLRWPRGNLYPQIWH
jgi:hypothetical protein